MKAEQWRRAQPSRWDRWQRSWVTTTPGRLAAGSGAEIHVVTCEVMDAFQRSQRWCFQTRIADQAADDRPILPLDAAAVVLAMRAAAGEGDARLGTVLQQRA